MTGKAIAYFFLGFVAGLIVVESQKDRPFAPVRFHDGKALETRIIITDIILMNTISYILMDILGISLLHIHKAITQVGIEVQQIQVVDK